MTEQMTEQMTDIEANSLWNTVSLVGKCLPSLEDLERLRDLNERAQAIGPILDPTLINQNWKQISNSREMLDAAIKFRRQWEIVFPAASEEAL